MVQPGQGPRPARNAGLSERSRSCRARGRNLRWLSEQIPEKGSLPSLPPPSPGSLQYDKCRIFWNDWILPPTTALFAISDQTACLYIDIFYIYFFFSTCRHFNRRVPVFKGETADVTNRTGELNSQRLFSGRYLPFPMQEHKGKKWR